MRQPLPPFTSETAAQKVRAAEDAWNSRDPERVALAYTPDCPWRNRDQFLTGHDAIVAFLRGKWARERDYRLIKQLWAHQDSRIAVRFAYEWHDAGGQWFRSYGNENWDFAEDGRPIGIEIPSPRRLSIGALNEALSFAQQPPVQEEDVAPLLHP